MRLCLACWPWPGLLLVISFKTMNKTIDPILLEAVIDVFTEEYNGAQNAKRSKHILYKLRTRGVQYISGKKFQAIIGHIRKNDLVYPKFILSNVHTGYWLSDSKAEQDDFVQQELNRMGNQFGNIELLFKRLKKAAITGPAQVQQHIFQ